MPRVHITSRQNYFSVGVGLDEFLSKGTSGPVTDSLLHISPSSTRYVK